MKIKDFMTTNIATCNPNSSLTECAELMKENDCGMIPIVSSNGKRDAIGVITDRDITLRTLGQGINPVTCKVSDIMTSDPVTISENASHEEAENLMERHQIRRLLVTDSNGDCCGVIAQADLARYASSEEIGEVVQHISASNSGTTRPSAP